MAVCKLQLDAVSKYLTDYHWPGKKLEIQSIASTE
jgi:hypothetical protein